MSVQRFLVREHPLREALADDDDGFGVAAIGFAEVTAGDDGNAERFEESRRDRPEPGARIFFTVGFRVPLDGELKARAEAAGVAPRHDCAHGHAVDPRQLSDAAHGLLVEIDDLVRRAPVRHDRDMDGEDVVHVEAGPRRLQREERGEEHAGAGEQQKRRGDLRDRERAQAPARPRRHPEAAARKADSAGGSARRQPRHVSEQHGRDERQPDADPEQRCIDRQIQRAHREARRVSRQNRHHRPRDGTPRSAPVPQSSRLSARSVRRSAPVLAPSAARIASSPSRRTERARTRFATFEHAITNTSAEAASRTSSTVLAREVI